MHAALALEALNGDFDTLNEGFVGVVEALLFFKFCRREWAVDVVFLEAVRFELYWLIIVEA